MRVAIAGVGETAFRTRHDDMTVAELAQAAAAEALEMASLKASDVDAVVFSMGPTEFIGITDVERSAASAIGAVGKPMMRVNTGGATGGSAAQTGYFHVASNAFEIVLVVGADKVSETPSAQIILGLIWDPFFERPFALNTVTMTALQAARHIDRHGTSQEQMAAAAVLHWGNATRNPRAHLKGRITTEDVMTSLPVAWPLKLYDCCPRSSGAAAAILVSERQMDRRQLSGAWINGVGGCGNTVFMGDRVGPRSLTELGEWSELTRAAARAYEMAGISDPVGQLDVIELYAPFSIGAIMGVEALGLCPPGQGGPTIASGFFDPGGEVALNPSGGTLCSNPIGVTGLVRVCDAALQVLGAAGSYQVQGVRTAVATAVGGSYQFHTCMVLGANPI